MKIMHNFSISESKGVHGLRSGSLEREPKTRIPVPMAYCGGGEDTCKRWKERSRMGPGRRGARVWPQPTPMGSLAV